MLTKKKCDFCKSVSAVTLGGRNLCRKHYFGSSGTHKVEQRLLKELGYDLDPVVVESVSRKKNHWSVLLRDLRVGAGMSQREMARRTRMSQRTIADYENIFDARQLSIYRVERLLKELGYDLDAVLVKKSI